MLVLAADDHPMNQHVLKLLLGQNEKFVLQIVCSGTEVLQVGRQREVGVGEGEEHRGGPARQRSVWRGCRMCLLLPHAWQQQQQQWQSLCFVTEHQCANPMTHAI
jgi:CheY-like chemotaxis protein